MNWPKYFLLWIPIFPIVMMLNQAFYGFTFKGYALAAAFPKVCIFTGVIAFVAYHWGSITGSTNNNNRAAMSPHERLPESKPIELVEENSIQAPAERTITLTQQEEELLNDHLNFYEELELGLKEPTTEAQRHFVDVVNGVTKPRTKHEHAFLKHIKIRDSKA